MDDDESTQWKGILLSILVICMVFGGICLSAFIIQPSKLNLYSDRLGFGPMISSVTT